MNMRKIIRDKIPEIVKLNNDLKEGLEIGICNSDDERRTLLLDKVVEEATELKEAPSLEEMADVIDVVYALAKTFGYDPIDIEKKRFEKIKLKGAFKKGYVLKSK